MDDLYLDNIDEYINDHNKIVTYKWLSLALGVHVNIAKQMLYHYLDRCRKDGSKSQLHATYLVTGKCNENGNMCHKVSVVREDKLEDMKSKMEPAISVHVYSLQKAEIKDSSTLYSTDYDAVRDNLKNCNKYSAIHCEAAVPLTTAELELNQEAHRTSSPEKVIKSVSNGQASVAKPNVKTTKGIMGMFANKTTVKSQASDIEVKVEKKEDAPLVEPSEVKPAGMATAVNKFFGKQTKKQDTCIKKEAEPSTRSSPVEKKHPELPSKSEDVKEKGLQECKTAKENKESRSKTKRVEKSDSEDERTEASAQRKKRRRIKKPQSDSSGDEETSATVVTMESPEHPTEKQSVMSPEVNTEGKKRKRRRVLKPKTFLDDEGCIVTEKVYESESYSEDGEEESSQSKPSVLAAPAKKEEGKKNAKKAPIVTNKASKQSSIMGFFQKK